MRPIGIMLTVAVPLAAMDLFVKASTPTEPWAYHRRSLAWLALSIVLFFAMLAISRIPSILVAPAAGVLCAGILGNSLSAAWNGMEVPNPLVIDANHAIVAFNLADVWAVSGIFLLVLSIGVWLIRNRDLLPESAEIRATRGRAFRRLFDSDAR
jgi:hypothetical protein